jgi:exosortase/archaeosortase family protein
MKKDEKYLFDLFVRYAILIIIAVFGFNLFYVIFRPLTVYPITWILDIFLETNLISSTILIIEDIAIEFVPACIAGAAYYLLLMLNLSTPKIELTKRIKFLLISFATFLIINIIRIIILATIALYGSSFFDITHAIFWYSLSTIFVIAIWFYGVRYFKIKEIPFYSDLKFLYKKSSVKK